MKEEDEVKTIIEYISQGEINMAINLLKKWFESGKNVLTSEIYEDCFSRFLLISSNYNRAQKDFTSSSQNEFPKIVGSLIELCLFLEKQINRKIDFNKNTSNLSQVDVEFTLNGNYNSFSEEKKNIFINTIIGLLDLQEGDFQIKLIRKGSVLITASIPIEKVGLLVKLEDLDVFKRFNIAGVLFSKHGMLPPSILLIPPKAFSGTTLGTSYGDETYFSIPGVKESGLIAFEIEGNSMDPIIQHGDIVVCKSVENLNEIHENEIYAVRSNDSVWVKYVQKIFNNRGRIIRLKLISANYFDNDPFEEEVNETTRLYKIIRKIGKI